MAEILVCTPKSLPSALRVEAARTAVKINPSNHPRMDRIAQFVPGFQPTQERIAAVTSKRWPTNGVRLTVAFLDNAPADFRARILSHMNAWAKTANVAFVESATNPQVRIARVKDGYWSYLGTDILHIAKTRQTMNLQDFTMQTPESEFRRVIRHETGHTLGFPHEHMRKELVDKIDQQKAIQYFMATQGWSEAEVRAQVLTPLDEATLTGTAHADANSIMCYQIPGSLTKDGKPIIGGADIDDQDYAFAGSLYPRAKPTGPKRAKRARRKAKRERPKATHRPAKKKKK